MNIVEEIKEIVTKLNEIDDYNGALNQKLNVLDEKTQDKINSLIRNQRNIIEKLKDSDVN